MVEAVMLWNEPNNLSHWDFKLDPDWKKFADMVLAAAKAIRAVNPELKLALGGISPIDPNFVKLLDSYGVIDAIDVVSVHGFPLDWNHWNISDWPKKLDEIRAVVGGKRRGAAGRDSRHGPVIDPAAERLRVRAALRNRASGMFGKNAGAVGIGARPPGALLC